MSEQQQSAAIPIQLFNAITDYLSSKPYSEVSQIIDALREQTKTVTLEAETPSEE